MCIHMGECYTCMSSCVYTVFLKKYKLQEGNFIITVVIIKLIIFYSYVKRLAEAKSQMTED
jgi:hypothetical protein